MSHALHASSRHALRSALAGPFTALGRHWELTRELTRRDILGRYRGANFGLMWSLIGPLMMLAIYTITFGEIMQSRWQQASGATAEFGIVLFIGIIIHGFFAECFARSPRLMLDNANYVKRVVFPLQVLPWSVVLSALFHMGMNLVVFVVLNALFFGSFSPHIVLLPLVLAPLVMLTIAVCWLVTSLGVYVRDISQAVPVIATGLFFISSAIIPLQVVPPRYRIFFEFNPLTFFIDQARNVALWNTMPDWAGLLKYAIIGLLGMYLAFAWFRVTSKGFADVL